MVRPGAVALAVVVLSVLLAACGTSSRSDSRFGSVDSARSASSRPAATPTADPKRQAPDPAIPCSTRPKTADNGYTAPGSVLCLGVTAHLPYYPGKDAKPVTMNVRVTAVEPSRDTNFRPSDDELAGRAIDVVRYTVSFDGRVDSLAGPWEIVDAVWSRDNGGQGVIGESPDDCVGAPFGADYGKAQHGCVWSAVSRDDEVYGAHWASLDDEDYQWPGQEVYWKAAG